MMQTTLIHARPRGSYNLGEVIRWGPLGPGGDPAMSLQSFVPGQPVSGLSGVRGLGEVIHWGPLGPGGDPAMSLQSWTRGQYVSGLGQADPGGASVEYGAQVTLPRMNTVLAAGAGLAVGVALGWFMGAR